MTSIILLSGCSADYGLYSETYLEVDGDPQVEEHTAQQLTLDIMLIIDESGSMSDEREWLRNVTMPDALDELYSQSEVDWRIGLRPTDRVGQGYGWVESTDPNPDQAVRDLLDMDRGTPGEYGFDSIGNSIGYDVYRTGDVLFWVISDEDDQSQYSSPTNMRSQLEGFRSYPDQANLAVSVYRTANELSCGQGGSGIGTAYIEASDWDFSLCFGDWTGPIDSAIERAKSKNKKWFLLRRPIGVDTIHVLIDGRETHQWSYEEGSNSVILTNSADPGELVTIVYIAESVN